MRKLLAILAASLTWGAATHAQPVIDPARFPTPYISVPLSDGDTAYRLSAVALNEQVEAVTLERLSASGDAYVEDTYLTPLNLSDSPTLEVLPNGSVAIRWGCFACGRYHTQTSVTVGFRDGQLMVLGYDDTYADRTVALVFSCSVNLLSGRYVIEADALDRQEGRSNDRAYPMRHLHMDTRPSACDGLQKYDDDWISANDPNR